MPSARSCSRASAISSGSAWRLAVQARGQLAAARARARSGSSAGSGLPRERSRAPGGTGSGARGEPIGGPWPMRVPRRGSLTTTPRRRSSASAGGDRRRAEADLGGEAPHRRQALAGRERAARDRRLDAAHQLRCAVGLDPILFQLSH